MRSIFAAAIIAAALTTGAQAQRAFYSPAGGSGTACTQAAPCADYMSAYSVAGDNGTIFHLSPGHFGSGVISSNAVNQQGFGQASGVAFLEYSHSAPRNVTVRDLSVSRTWYGPAGANYHATGGSLTLENISFSTPDSANMSGVLFAPGGAATLSLKNVSFNGFSTGVGAAIRIVTGGQNVNVTLDNVNVSGGIRGIVIDTSGGGWAKVNIENSSFTNITGPAIYGNAGSGNIRLYLDNVSATNSNVGVVMAGANALAWMTQSKIAGNATGIQQAAGAKIYSYKDNQIFNNGTDGTPLPASPSPVQSMPGGEIASVLR